MILEQLKVRVKGKIVKAFKKSAKEAFPNETLAYLLGTIRGKNLTIESLYFPPDVDKFCTPKAVHVQRSWFKAATKEAKTLGLEVVGDLHSHPYQWSALKSIKTGCPLPDAAPSEGDWDSESVGLVGICLVKEQKGGKKVARVKFFAPMLPQVAVIE